MAKTEQNIETPVVKEDKVKFGSKIKNGCAEFGEKHPKLVKGAKTVGKIVGAGLIFAGGVLAGSAMANREDSDGLTSFLEGGTDFEEIFDDHPTED